MAVGWGVTSENTDEASDILQQVAVPLIPREKCVKLPRPYNLVSTHAICAGYNEGGQDACTGDSGGPLLCQTGENSPWIVYGVTSWGYGCGRAGKPGVYTKVNMYNKWITGVTGIVPSIGDEDYPKVSCDETTREAALNAPEPTTTTTTTTTTTEAPTEAPTTEEPLPENPQLLGICSAPQFSHNSKLFDDLPAHRRRRQAAGFFNNRLPPTSSSNNSNKKGKKKNNKSEKINPSAIFAAQIAPPKDEAALEMEQILIKDKRIIGGEQARENSWPWMVYITISSHNKENSCGGTLIGNQWVLTAAHCIPKFSVNITSENGKSITKSPKLTLPNLEKRFDIKQRSSEELKGIFKMKVYLGAHDITDLQNAESRDVVDIITHPEFNRPMDYNNDVALLKLETPVHFTSTISPLCLPDENVCMKEGVPCVTTGWGVTDELDIHSTAENLQEVVVRVISNEKCLTYPENADMVSDQMICAGYKDGGKDACSGDSGGPLMCKVDENGPWVFYGITSFGIGCARPDAPGVYARVPKFVDWINEVTQLQPGITTQDFPALHQDNQCGGWTDSAFVPEKTENFFDVSGRQAKECDVVETAPVKITSANHPRPYKPDTDCRYCVKSENQGGFVQLEITDLRLDQKRNCYPNDDYIVVEDKDGNPLSNPICRIIRRSPIKAMAKDAICIRMMSNEKVQRAGFKALFSEVNEFQSACGGNANSVAAVNDRYPKRKISAERIIKSANFPGKEKNGQIGGKKRVPPGSECSWHIEAPRPSQVVQINFSFFKLAKNCKFHFVALYSSPDCSKDNLTPENQVAVLCGLKKRKAKWEHFSTGQGLCIVMVTDKTSVSAGFEATYQAISKDSVPVKDSQGSRSNELELVKTERVNIPDSIGKNYWVIGN